MLLELLEQYLLGPNLCYSFYTCDSGTIPGVAALPSERDLEGFGWKNFLPACRSVESILNSQVKVGMSAKPASRVPAAVYGYTWLDRIGFGALAYRFSKREIPEVKERGKETEEIATSETIHLWRAEYSEDAFTPPSELDTEALDTTFGIFN
ncbi:hypothetical protein COLO4_03224 [Corchorus olitorius]|uniref:Uncharacterized protein n=1 Tax=Corchorus olitorius TaxID=93759 RepID=A0A1R3KZE7_9ROSI|nr:hypothetical protein COLO4_03224 [Corchorus olitorius]